MNMRWAKELWRRVRHIGNRNTFHNELDDEILFHITTRTDELEQTGLSRREALAQARREFGSTARMQEETHEAWQFHWIEDLWSDLRYGLRSFRRDKAFTAAAILSLALGIGINTTIFSLTMEFLFSKPSARNPERLVDIRIGGSSHAPMREFQFVHDAHDFEGLAGRHEEAVANWRYGTGTYRVFSVRVTDNYFDVTGVPIAMGRPIQRGEDTTAVLTDHFWHNRLGADPQVLGRTLFFDGKPYTVVGVLPHDHRTLLGYGYSPDVYLPVGPHDEKQVVALVARLPDGMTRQVALERVKAICRQLDKTYPQEDPRSVNNSEVISLSGFDRFENEGALPIALFFGMLMVVVGLVLLIACANVASLLLARASSRRQEIAVRLAIGASRSRVIRQLLAESLLLATLGTTAGLVVNLLLTSATNRIQFPLPIPVQLMIQPDWRLLAYSTAVALLTALVSGLMPALKATRSNVSSTMKQGEHQVREGRWTLRNALVTGQLAVSILLLATGFLFLRNLMKATSMNPGFDVQHTAWAQMRLVPERYPKQENVRPIVSAAINQLRAMPGVEAASVVATVPLNDNYTIGAPVRADSSQQSIPAQWNYNRVSADYFRTMGIPILAGRAFSPTDDGNAPAVVIINENFARLLFGNANPVGHTISYLKGKPMTIVGLARNSKYFTLGEENKLALYLPYFQNNDTRADLSFLVRAERPEAVVKEVTTVLEKLDSSASVETKLMRNALMFALLPSRMGALLLGSIGFLGLALASIGLYGVLAYAVSRRTREIGLRVALGADRAAVLGMVARQSLSLVAIAIAAGLGIAFFATKPLAMFLVPDLSPRDPVSFLAVIGVLLLVALAATLGPALRALRIDPMEALRYE
jgi:predicted permease